MGAIAPAPLTQNSSVISSQTEIDGMHELKQEIKELKAIIDSQAKDISEQKGAVATILARKESNNTALYAAIGVVLAALIGGFFTIRNNNKQAKQERLLKAIELIMQSSSGYQADIRKQNLSVFLDDETKNHLDDIKTKFSGPEYTELHVTLAEAMSSKAETPDEVLRIWKTVLKDKKFFDRLAYPDNNAKQQS